MTSKHTPGPWEVGAAFRKHLIYDSYIREIACVSTDTKNAEANARLIAAAPELLEALKKLVPITWNDGPLAKAYETIGKQAEQAIAKATKEVER